MFPNTDEDRVPAGESPPGLTQGFLFDPSPQLDGRLEPDRGSLIHYGHGSVDEAHPVIRDSIIWPGSALVG